MSYWKPAAILVAILLLLVVTSLTINPVRPAGGKPGTQKFEAKSKYVDLGEFLINLNSDYGNQYVKTSISLKLGQSGKYLEVDARVPEIRHHVNLVLQSQTADELATNEGKLKLAEVIKEHTEYVMGFRKTLPVDGVASEPIKVSAISDVLFTSFIIQH